MCLEHCLSEHLQNETKITVGSFSGFQTILWIHSFARSSTHFILLFYFVLCSLIFVILDTEPRALFMLGKPSHYWAVSPAHIAIWIYTEPTKHYPFLEDEGPTFPQRIQLE